MSKKTGMWISFFLPFGAPVPCIAVFSQKEFLTEHLGTIGFTACAVVAIALAAGLFLVPFITSFGSMLGGGGYQLFWGKGKKAQHILINGQKARATIKSVGENSGGGTMTINGHPVLNLVFDVEDQFGRHLEVSQDILIPRAQVPQFQPGTSLPVKIDADNPVSVVFDSSGAEVQPEVLNSSGPDDPDVAAIRENGIDGLVAILKITDSGRTEDFKPVVEFLMEVTVPGKMPYTVTKELPLETTAIEMIRENIGKSFSCRVHPTDAEKIVIDFSS